MFLLSSFLLLLCSSKCFLLASQVEESQHAILMMEPELKEADGIDPEDDSIEWVDSGETEDEPDGRYKPRDQVRMNLLNVEWFYHQSYNPPTLPALRLGVLTTPMTM